MLDADLIKLVSEYGVYEKCDKHVVIAEGEIYLEKLCFRVHI
jgi:hypothetical protein